MLNNIKKTILLCKKIRYNSNTLKNSYIYKIENNKSRLETKFFS
nr:MAG TPA: hypothetical protein [Caudoviricetes sp.]